MSMRLNGGRASSSMPQSSVSDIAFLLMVFFVLTSSWAVPHILSVSSGTSAQNVRASDISDIVITNESVLLDGTAVSESSLPGMLRYGHKYRILTDDDAPYHRLVSVLDILHKHSITEVQVVCDET